MKPLVLVHGFMGGSDQWVPQSPLAVDRDLIRVDLPGFGRNADLPAFRTIEGFAAWVLEHPALQGVPDFDLLGHSMGGMIVQEMTRLAPERVARLVLYGTGAVGLLPGRFEPIETSMQRARNDGPKATAGRIAATWFRDREASPAYASCAAIAEKSTLPAILAGLEAMRDWSGVDHLGKITCPSLILWGDCDRTYPRAQIETLHTGIPQSRLVVVPGCAHVVHLEKSDFFNQTIVQFLNDQMVP